MDMERQLLLVDDEEFVGRAFRRVAGALGYKVDFVQSASEAIARGRKHPYPVVVTDLSLPDVDGCALIDAMTPMCPQTAFVIITGDPAAASGRVTQNGAVIALMKKPWDDDELASKLALAFDAHQTRTSLRTPAANDTASVLLLEDSPSATFMLKTALETVAGTRVTNARTLEEGTRLLRSRSFDVIMTELALPDARGLDAVVRLRHASPEAAMIVCTSVDDPALSLQLVQLGVQECVQKTALDVSSVSRVLMFARERKRSELQLARLAYHDPVTGLANRSGWREHAPAALARAQRRRERAAVLMIDLDGFKDVNDSLGHDAGDELLQEIGRRLRNIVREYDMVARFGGDEFAVLLSDMGEDANIAQLAERVREEISKPVLVGRSIGVRVGASIGVAVYPGSADSLDGLITAADAAMYQAKRAGKHRIVVHTVFDA